MKRKTWWSREFHFTWFSEGVDEPFGQVHRPLVLLHFVESLATLSSSTIDGCLQGQHILITDLIGKLGLGFFQSVKRVWMVIDEMKLRASLLQLRWIVWRISRSYISMWEDRCPQVSPFIHFRAIAPLHFFLYIFGHLNGLLDLGEGKQRKRGIERFVADLNRNSVVPNHDRRLYQRRYVHVVAYTEEGGRAHTRAMWGKSQVRKS